MAHYTGFFFGYREIELKAVGRIALPIWELEGPVPHAMEVITGDAPDAYGAIQVFTNETLILLIQVENNSGAFQLSSDGVTVEDEIDVDPDKNLGSWFHRYEAIGFRVKNKVAGATCAYRVIAYW